MAVLNSPLPKDPNGPSMGVGVEPFRPLMYPNQTLVLFRVRILRACQFQIWLRKSSHPKAYSDKSKPDQHPAAVNDLGVVLYKIFKRHSASRDAI